MSSVLEVENLVKDYGTKRAVNDLSFSVQAGEIFGLLGPNGAGKSTTLECILGTKAKTSGRVTLLGHEGVEPKSKTYSKIISRVGVQFQKSFFLERIKVGEMCQMISALYEEVTPYEELLKLFGLNRLIKQDVSKLSGGEQQKLSLVLALLHKPDLVFLDELTTGLDPSARRDVWSILKKLQKEGLTIVLTSHYMDEVMQLCDRILVISQGEIRYTGTTEEALKWTGTTNLEDAYLSLIGERDKNESFMGVV
tara:strand:- start:169 stop:924 length:756 start_codon:yes stop_codon:yes gene_type:complete